MGEENKSTLFAAFTDDGHFIPIDDLHEISLESDAEPGTFYMGVDLSAAEDCTVVAETMITPELIYHVFGLPPESLPDCEDEFTRFKMAMWPFFSEGRLSRKRFKKLLMAHGVSRNLAEKAAVHYNRQRIPYFYAYKEAVAHCWIKGIIEGGQVKDKDGE